MRTLFSLLGFIILTGTLQAQNSGEEAVQAVIEQLFDGMRESDSTKVQDAFTGDAIMQTVARDQSGSIKLHEGDLKRFVSAVGSPKKEIWDERIASYEIKIDGPLASVWTPYQFYRGDTFSHCGVNSFQLMKTEDGWKIFHIVDTRKREGCVEG